MSIQNPVILLTFANPAAIPEAYLASLSKESNLVYRHLIQYEIDDLVNIDRLESATVEQVFDTVDAWSKRKDIVLFHYGGHADGGNLLLTDEEGGVNTSAATGLARLLGRIDTLQLVFLNGCSTYPQVQLLLQSGIKAVIATSVPVDDEMALDFADRFYKDFGSGSTVEAAFNQASAFIETKYKARYEIESPAIFRSIGRKQTSEEKAKLPWGLYLNQGAEEVLSWRLPQQSTLRNSYSIIDKYTCNRSEQNSRFKTHFLKNRLQTKFLYFLIHGLEEQSPNGLFNRFVLEHIGTTYDRYFHKIHPLESASELEEAKINAITAFFQALELNPNRYSPVDLNLSTLANSKIAKEMDCVAIMFRIYSSEWKSFTPDFIRWVVKEFCDPSLLPPDAPDFFLFVNIIYDAKEEEGGLFSRLFKKSPRQQILKAVESFKLILPLPELPPVFLQDINKWFDRLTEDPEVKRNYIKQYFSNRKEMAMSRVEKKLEKIIEEFNS